MRQLRRKKCTGVRDSHSFQIPAGILEARSFEIAGEIAITSSSVRPGIVANQRATIDQLLNKQIHARDMGILAVLQAASRHSTLSLAVTEGQLVFRLFFSQIILQPVTVHLNLTAVIILAVPPKPDGRSLG